MSFSNIEQRDADMEDWKMERWRKFSVDSLQLTVLSNFMRIDLSIISFSNIEQRDSEMEDGRWKIERWKIERWKDGKMERWKD